MHDAGAALRSQRVAAIYLVHGSFDAAQLAGVLAGLRRAHPSAADGLRDAARIWLQQSHAAAGHFTDRYAWTLESALHAPGEPCIPVRLFHWSGENHHLGRADAAVRLIDELASLALEPGERVLLWGHGHAGNVFALMTHLLSGNLIAIERFFRAAEAYYRWPVVGLVDIPVWQRVYGRLQIERPLLEDAGLDLVTFGTPVRYGWDPSGYSRLLHFVHRRAARGEPLHQAHWPLEVDDVLRANGGDYIQQLGIAGTNTPPSPLAWRAWLADRRLQQLLQGDLSDGAAAERFRVGTIVPDEGDTLLVDYAQPDSSLDDHHAGHAVYTQRRWQLFHAEEIARRFYTAHAACRAA